jgi:xanthine/CO dehydrogenase XdhC/CoxF family maturation factor
MMRIPRAAKAATTAQQAIFSQPCVLGTVAPLRKMAARPAGARSRDHRSQDRRKVTVGGCGGAPSTVVTRGGYAIA